MPVLCRLSYSSGGFRKRGGKPDSKTLIRAAKSSPEISRCLGRLRGAAYRAHGSGGLGLKGDLGSGRRSPRLQQTHLRVASEGE